MSASCRVVAISRSLGAGGEEAGRLAARELGFRYADEEIIVRAAKAAGVSPEKVSQAEMTPGLVARVLEGMARHAVTPEGWAAAPLVIRPETDNYEALIRRVIIETAREGDVVMVAHGASIPLAAMSDVLRVLVTASPDVRAERLAGGAGLSAAEARKAVRDSDRQRREFLRRFYEVKEELPTLYDIVVNTDTLTVEQSARLITAAVRR